MIRPKYEVLKKVYTDGFKIILVEVVSDDIYQGHSLNFQASFETLNLWNVAQKHVIVLGYDLLQDFYFHIILYFGKSLFE